MIQQNDAFKNPELLKRVIELKEVEKKPVEEAIKILKEEFNLPTLVKDTYKNLYNRAVATTITVDKKAGHKFEEYTLELEKMYGQVIKTLGRLIDSIDRIYDEFEASDVEESKKYINFIKLAPQIKMTTDQILAIIKHQEEQQDKIRIEQKNLVWNTDTFKEKIDNYLKILAKDGKIKILKEI